MNWLAILFFVTLLGCIGGLIFIFGIFLQKDFTRNKISWLCFLISTTLLILIGFFAAGGLAIEILLSNMD